MQEYTSEFLGDGLRYELQEFLEAIRSGTYPRKLTSDESATMAYIMEQFLRRQNE